MPKRSYFLLLLFVGIAAILALGLRLRAVNLLPQDYDEDDYLYAAQYYAEAIQRGDWQAVIDYDYNYEHPPLTKLVYSLALLPLPQEKRIAEPKLDISLKSTHPEYFRRGRLTSTALSTLEVIALALLDPLAGLFLAIHTYQIKYSTQIMLEPLPALTSLLAALLYMWARKAGPLPGQVGQSEGKHKQRAVSLRLGLAALALGMTAAAKYTYCVVGIAIVVDWAWQVLAVGEWRTSNGGERAKLLHRTRSAARRLAPVVGWGLLAIVFFIAFDPYLWHAPLPRLAQSLLFHGDYAQSAHVQEAGFPTWQPLVWLMSSVPWQREVFVFHLDLFITLLAMFGLRRLWHKERMLVLWLGIGLFFLLLWPTKWPQYILILTAPLCLAASEGLRAALWEPALAWLRARRIPRPAAEHPAEARLRRRTAWRDTLRAWPWLLPGLLTLTIIAVYPLIYQAAMSLTDFNTISIRDGIQGGVWRAVWQGLTGQEEAVHFDPFEGTRAKEVHYAGPLVLLALLGGAAPDILVFNIIWVLASVALQTALGVAVALALGRQGVRLAGLWRAIFILPWAIPEFVGALVWLRVLEPRYGWFAISQQQLPAGVDLGSWTDSADKTLFLLLVAATWYGFPFIMLAATAGLKLVPKDVYDAAAIDGAGAWGRFRFVTWPLLLPLVVPAIIIRSIFAFNQFYLFYAMRINYPTLTYATISYFFFSPGFGGQFAVSAGINIFTVLVLIALILWFNRVSRAAEGVTYA